MEHITTIIDLCMKHLPRLTRTAVFLYWTYVVLQILQKGQSEGVEAVTAPEGFISGVYILMLYFYFKTQAPKSE